MEEHNILDAPEDDNKPELFSFRLIILTILGFLALFSFFFLKGFTIGLSSYSFEIQFLEINLEELIFLLSNCICLYFFFSFANIDLDQWFRGVTVSVSIIFLALLITVFVVMKLLTPGVVMVSALRGIVFISLIGGGGCSLAVQFLVKKKYLIFSAIMICTIVFFSFIDKL